MAGGALAEMRYRVAMPEPASHELVVTMEVPALSGRRECELVFPAWAPGSYMVRDFVRHVYDLEITDRAGRRLGAERLDKQRWRVQSGGRAFRVTHRVFAFDQSVRTSFLDESRGFFNGTSVFFFVDGELGRPCLLEVVPPAAQGPGPRSGQRWKVAIALPRVPGRKLVFRASGFDELVDSPCEIGTHQELAFHVGKTRFDVTVSGRTNADLPRLADELRRVAAATGRLFAGFPFERYLFIVHALPARGGGLEHARSATLDVAGMSFDDDDGYRGFAELAAHELFHAWNVKRIRDRALGPFDYTRENYTRLLWFHEGFTQYMEGILLLRAGLLTPRKYLDGLAEAWGKYATRPGRNVTPLSELSFEAWIKQYKPADNHINKMVSYYDKGRWAALALELVLREATAGRRGIAELFRLLWRRFGRPDQPISDVEVRATAAELAGRSLDRFFARYIDGTDEIPVPTLLRRAGITVRARPHWRREEDRTKRQRGRAWAGLSFAPAGGATGTPGGTFDRALVRNVAPDSPAWAAGLTFGDEVLAVDGLRVNASSVTRRLADARPGARSRIAYFRQDTLCFAEVVLARNPERHWELAIDPHAGRRAREIRRGWLGR